MKVEMYTHWEANPKREGAHIWVSDYGIIYLDDAPPRRLTKRGQLDRRCKKFNAAFAAWLCKAEEQLRKRHWFYDS